MSIPLVEINYFPTIRPSAIAVGLAFSHVSNLISSHPVFGSAFKRAKSSETKEEFLRSREAASAAAVYGATFVGSSLQSYALAALLKAAGANTYKEAAYVGSLVFVVTSLPALSSNLIVDGRHPDIVFIKVLSALLNTVGVALTLTWWGVDDSPA